MSDVTVIPLMEIEPIALPGGSWSRMLVTDRSVSGNRASLGYSVFTPGTVLQSVSHDAEEVAYVVQGNGELRLKPTSQEQGADVVSFAAGDALFIPPHTWHAVANTGSDDVIMVFGFPHPDYPPTERR